MKTNAIEGWIVFGLVLVLAAAPFAVAYFGNYVWQRLAQEP